MSDLLGQSWKLDRYARFLYKHNEHGKVEEWKHYDNANGTLVMTFTDSKQLIISQDLTLLESHNLVTAHAWMRGLSRNDSFLFMYKFKTEMRRFRVRFSKDGNASGREVCICVTQQLSNYFPIKHSLTENGATNGTNDDRLSGMMQTRSLIVDKQVKSSTGTQLCGEVTLDAVAQATLKTESLPMAYQEHQEKPDMTALLVRVCLGDPAFPAFVESVEAAMKAIIGSNNITCYPKFD